MCAVSGAESHDAFAVLLDETIDIAYDFRSYEFTAVVSGFKNQCVEFFLACNGSQFYLVFRMIVALGYAIQFYLRA